MTAETSDQGMDELFAATYGELRRLASAVKGRDKSVTLNPTALVHEAWIKLSASAGMKAVSELHFKRMAARAMRQVLIEAARKRNALKRGGASGAVYLTTDFPEAPAVLVGDELIALDGVLDELARMNARQAAMVESRFFGGLEMAEIAELLGVSQATVLRDWRAARAWLAQALKGN
jgi:RNA polymerase sigma factor (TIGR02999 family)